MAETTTLLEVKTGRGAGRWGGARNGPWGVGFLLLLALALAVRVIHLGALEIWNDEAHSVLTATSPRGIWQELQNDNNPPLYFLMLKIWCAVFGITPAAVRAMSVAASVGAVGVTGILLRRCGAGRLAVLWAMGLMALAPLQIHYAQQARGYALCCLLVALDLWTFVRAVQTRRWVDFGWHALCVGAGFYVHPAMVFFAAVFWLAAPMLRLKWADYGRLAAAHGAAVLCFAPGLLLMREQFHNGSASDWIKTFWAADTPPWLMIPRSLEILFLGGPRPAVAVFGSVTGMARWGAVLLMVVGLGAALWRGRRGGAAAKDSAGGGRLAGTREDAMGRALNSLNSENENEPTMARYIALFAIAALWPLVWMLAFSLLVRPIYILGRYDVLAQPAFLALLGVGFARLQTAVRVRVRNATINAMGIWRWAALAPAGFVVAVAGWSLMGRWQWPEDAQNRRHDNRSVFLQSVLAPDDRLLCLGLEAGPTIYYARLRHLTPAVATFPTDTMTHVGWTLTDDQLMADPAARLAQATALFDQAARSRTGRIWIVLDPGVGQWAPGEAMNARQKLNEILQTAAARTGWQPLPLDASLATDLGLVCLQHGDAVAHE